MSLSGPGDLFEGRFVITSISSWLINRAFSWESCSGEIVGRLIFHRKVSISIFWLLWSRAVFFEIVWCIIVKVEGIHYILRVNKSSLVAGCDILILLW